MPPSFPLAVNLFPVSDSVNRFPEISVPLFRTISSAHAKTPTSALAARQNGRRRRRPAKFGPAPTPASTTTSHLQPRRLLEVRRADALADDVPLGAARHEHHLALIDDVLQLLADLAHLAHRLGVDEVLGAPTGGVAAGGGKEGAGGYDGGKMGRGEGEEGRREGALWSTPCASPWRGRSARYTNRRSSCGGREGGSGGL